MASIQQPYSRTTVITTRATDRRTDVHIYQSVALRLQLWTQPA